MKVAFGTVLYVQAKEFLPEFLASVECQTWQDFERLYINDNYQEGDLPFKTICHRGLSPAQLRIELLHEAKKAGVDLLIIGDADDTFVETRIERLVKAYEKDAGFAFYYNDLVGCNGLKIFKELPEEITDVVGIAQKNFLGMSTTAINMRLVPDSWIDTLNEGNCPIFDWYLYTRILMDLGPGKYVEEAATIYRIHEGNEVGVTVDIEREKQVKLNHYQMLSKRYPYFKELHDKLENASEIIPTNDISGCWWAQINLD